MTDKNHLLGMTISPVQFGRAWDQLDPKHRSGVNQNLESYDMAQRLLSSSGFAKRAEVLAKLLSPNGKVNIDKKDLEKQLECFPQSTCWEFTEKPE